MPMKYKFTQLCPGRSYFPPQKSDLASFPISCGTEKMKKLYLILPEDPERPELVSNQACGKQGIFWEEKKGIGDHRDAPEGWARNRQRTETRGTHSVQCKTPRGTYTPCAIKDRGMA